MASVDPFGTQVKRARERRHMTQQELADLLGVDRKTVDNWEHDRTYPRNRIGALEQWAPELAEDTDPQEQEFFDLVERLRGNPYVSEAYVNQLLAEHDKRKRRGSGDGPRQRIA